MGVIVNADEEVAKIFFRKAEDLEKLLKNYSSLALRKVGEKTYAFATKKDDFNLKEKTFDKKTSGVRTLTTSIDDKINGEKISMKDLRKELKKAHIKNTIRKVEDGTIVFSFKEADKDKIENVVLKNLEKKMKDREKKQDKKDIHSKVKAKAKERSKEQSDFGKDKNRKQEHER